MSKSEWFKQQEIVIGAVKFFTQSSHSSDLKAYIAGNLPKLSDKQVETIAGLLGVDTSLPEMKPGPYQWFNVSGPDSRIAFSKLLHEINLKKWAKTAEALKDIEDYKTLYEVAQAVRIMVKE